MASAGITAILHFPGVSLWRVQEIWDLLVFNLGAWGITLSRVLVNPLPEELHSGADGGGFAQLLMISGLEEATDWAALLEYYGCLGKVSRLLCILSSSLARADRVQALRSLPLDFAARAAGLRTTLMDNFLAGYFNGRAPYGYVKVPLAGSRPARDRSGHRRKGPCVLELGDPDQVGMVRFIFDAIADCAVTRSQLVHRLNAQRVPPPPAARNWSHPLMTKILSDPVCIGANRHEGFVRHDIFPAIISKEQFFRVQTCLALGERKAKP